MQFARSAVVEICTSADLDFFPTKTTPVFFGRDWKPPPNLPSLAAYIDRALETQGVAREKRNFAAHLTLARFEPPGLHEKLRAAIQTERRREFGSFQTREFHLIESKLKPSGAAYTTLATFHFTKEE